MKKSKKQKSFILCLAQNPKSANYHPPPIFVLFGYDYLNVMMARAENRMEDMLFIGGDFNNQGFTAWKRID